MVSERNAGEFAAAVGALALHALAVVAVLSLVGPPLSHRHVPPVQVALLTPPRPDPAQPARPPPPRRPEPAPQAQTKPSAMPPRPAPLPMPAPVPAPSPLVAARPVEESRPAAITAQAAPADAPVAPRVVQGTPQPPAQPKESPPPSAAPQRVGPRADASWSGNAPPAYPAMARRMGEEGEVLLDVHVGPDGSVLEVRLRKSSGSRLLDQTAIETVKKWRFSPATVDGRPVAEWYRDWKWVFKLES